MISLPRPNRPRRS